MRIIEWTFKVSLYETFDQDIITLVIHAHLDNDTVWTGKHAVDIDALNELGAVYYIDDMIRKLVSLALGPDRF